MVRRKSKYGSSGFFWGCSTYPRCKQTKRYAPPSEQKPQAKAWDPSKYQIAIREDVKTGKGHVVIKAGPGCAKTTTGVWVTAYVPDGLSVAFIAFNKKIQVEFSRKLPPRIHASTCHSLGLGNATNALGKLKVEPNKLTYIIKDVCDGLSFEDAERVQESMAAIKRLVSLLKGTLMEPTIESLAYIADRWQLELNGDRDLIFDVSIEVFGRSIEQLATIDFDDMIWLSATGRVPCKQFDMLFVDETQDLNKAQVEMALRSIKPGGRIIAVGDEHQSIYGFRGADTDAIPNLIERLEARTLPLSVSYRLPLSGVELANTIFPGLEAAPGAIEGILDSVSEYQFLDQVKVGDLVLCRTNAPLVRPAFNLIRQGTKAVILGRDIGKGLMALVKKIQKRYRVVSLDDTLESLAEYERLERARLLKQGKDMAAEILIDKIATIHALCDGCYTVGDLERRIDDVFSDDAEGVTFSTVHKAKGSEADRVFLLKPELIPHPKASADWELAQEWNILYVAVTRHKKALYYVGGEPPFKAGVDETPAVSEEKTEETPRVPEPVVDEKEFDEPALDPAKLDKLPLEQKESERQAILDMFPKEGQFEGNIYRPSAWDFVNHMPSKWVPVIDAGQLVMEYKLSEDSTIKVYTSVKVGQIAGGTGDDSIRVVRIDVRKRDNRAFAFKNPQDWITRQVPSDCDTPEQAMSHLVQKVKGQVNQFVQKCPECGKPQVKCNAGRGRDARTWWRGLYCRHGGL